MKSETLRLRPSTGSGHRSGQAWNLKCAVVAGVISIVLASLTACLPVMSTPSLPAPTAWVFLPYVARMPTTTPSPTPSPTPTPTATPAPSPTFTPVPTPDFALTRGPYLQSVTTDTIIVAWETDLPSHGEVAYGETEGYGSSVADPSTLLRASTTVDTRHAVTLTGLAPYTFYHYRVESGGAPLSEDATFRTAAGPDQATFTFVVFGDTRTQHQCHQTVVESIRARQPDFALHTGDLVAHGHSAHEWETFFEIERELMARVPLFPTLGNHEGYAPLYFDAFYLPGNERWYAFDYGNGRFISLQVDGIADFGPGSQQYAWLEETLAANTQPWLFVYFHIPPYSALREDAEEIEVREALTPLFEQYSVDVVFNGHHHDYQRSAVNGVTYVVTGGGGAPIYPVTQADEHLLAYKNTYHVVHVTIAGDTLTGVGVTPDGEEFDHFTLTLP